MRRPIDIIIPIYNAFDDLNLCIDSVMKYTDLTLDRLILINDCSPDERIVPYLQGLVDNGENKNIVFLNNESNMGFSNNVNKGMMYSACEAGAGDEGKGEAAEAGKGEAGARDVILLNSDTIVTKGWVDKIVACAYSDEAIGTVTPMSNSATLCSYPVICQDNDVPQHLTVDEIAEAVERGSLKKYPRITVAVGFCMFIKRETIEKVGLFDAETFERGYGEENDFCNRAEQYGYIHVMCDDTFIYHKGTVSFLSEQKQKLIDEHSRILDERYPEQMKKNSEYCNAGRDKYIRENIDIYATADPKKKSIMFVVQADFHREAFDNIGGTQFHVRDLTMQLKDNYNVYVAARDRDYLRVTLYSDDRELSLKYYIDDADGYPRLYNKQLYEMFLNFYKAFKIDVVHVHHTYKLGFDMIQAAHKLGIPVVLTMHDYYHVCPTIKMVDCDGRFCEKTEVDEACGKCLRKSGGIAIGEKALVSFRQEVRKMLKMCDRVVMPTKAAREHVLKFYPEIREKSVVIMHGLDLEADAQGIRDEDIIESCAVEMRFDNIFDNQERPSEVRGWACIPGINSDVLMPYLEIECGGNVTFEKATKVLRFDVECAKKSKKNLNSGFVFNSSEYEGKDVNVRVLLCYKGKYYTDFRKTKATALGTQSQEVAGDETVAATKNVAFLGGLGIEKGSRKVYEMITSIKSGVNWHIFGMIAEKELHDLEQDNLVKHGIYAQKDIKRLLRDNRIDVVCILPIWGETFCYTISEAIACNIPVFTTDIGATGERVKEAGYGWTVDVNLNGAQMGEKLLDVLYREDEYNEKKKAATEAVNETLKSMADHYEELYADCEKVQKKDFADFDREFIFEGLGIAAGKERADKRESEKLEVAISLGNYFENYLESELRKVDEENSRLENELRAAREALASTEAVLSKIQNQLFYKTLRKIKRLIRR